MGMAAFLRPKLRSGQELLVLGQIALVLRECPSVQMTLLLYCVTEDMLPNLQPAPVLENLQRVVTVLYKDSSRNHFPEII